MLCRSKQCRVDLNNNTVISQFPSRQTFPAETMGESVPAQYPTVGGISEKTMAGKTLVETRAYLETLF